MKKYAAHIATIAFLTFVTGQMTASIGDMNPETIFTPWELIQAFTFLIGVIIIGFLVGQEHEQNKHNHEKM